MTHGARKRKGHDAKKRHTDGHADVSKEEDPRQSQVFNVQRESLPALPLTKISPWRILLKSFFGIVALLCFGLAILPFIDPQGKSLEVWQRWQAKSIAAKEARKLMPESSSSRLNDTEKRQAEKATRHLRTNLPFKIPERHAPDQVLRSADAARRDAVRAAISESWSAYVEDAFGADEYHPISRTGTNFSSNGGVGYFIIDVIDILLLIGDKNEYERARDWVADLSWHDKSGRFSVFETTIRTLGGLLSAHALCSPLTNALSQRTSKLCGPNDAALFLGKAVELAEQLKPAFEAHATGFPEREIDFSTGEVFADRDNRGLISLAEASTIQLEFKYLAHLTSDQRWWRLAERPMEHLRRASQRSNTDGLLPIFVNAQMGVPIMSEIRLGSRGDSYYEYLIKQYVQTNRTEMAYLDMFQISMTGIKLHLLKLSVKRDLLHTVEVHPRMHPQTRRPLLRIVPKQDHLVCFLGGTFMLGALHVQETLPFRPEYHIRYPPTDMHSPLAVEDRSIGHELIKTCVDTYTGTKTGLSPEIAMFRMVGDFYQGPEQDWFVKKQVAPPAGPNGAAWNARLPKREPLIDARNILRPETVESLFVAFHITGDEQYREWGWTIFEAFQRSARLTARNGGGRDGPYASIRDVEADAKDIEFEDRLETFTLSETFKYLYLLYDAQDGPGSLRLDEWVLNTEAHPLPIFTPTFETNVI